MLFESQFSHGYAELSSHIVPLIILIILYHFLGQTILNTQIYKVLDNQKNL